jgi:hypothetical protein
MGLYRTPSHLELFRNFRIVTALQEQVDDLPLSRAQSNWFIFHPNSFRSAYGIDPKLIVASSPNVSSYRTRGTLEVWRMR